MSSRHAEWQSGAKQKLCCSFLNCKFLLLPPASFFSLALHAVIIEVKRKSFSLAFFFVALEVGKIDLLKY
jgi:hypothetical protein